MRINNPGQDLTFDSAADLSTKQFLFMKGAATATGGQLARVNTAGSNERMLGVLQNKPNAANLGAVVRVSGVTKLVVDGSGTAITVGLPLKSNASGQGVAAATDKDHVGAIALEASTAAGDVIAVLIVNYDLAA